MKTNPNWGLTALLKERAALTSEVRRALSVAKLDIKQVLDREINVLLFPYSVWVTIPEVRQSLDFEKCEHRWVLAGDVQLVGAERLDVQDYIMFCMPTMHAQCNPTKGLEDFDFRVSFRSKEEAQENLRFANFIAVRLEELKAIFKEANDDLQELISPIKAKYDRLSVVNQELRELTFGVHGAELNLPELEDCEPTDPGFLSFDDDDSDDIWGGNPPLF